MLANDRLAQLIVDVGGTWAGAHPEASTRRDGIDKTP